MENKKENSSGATKFVEVMPLKNFVISYNEVFIELVKGKGDKVPDIFIQNLKTEGVISSSKEI